MLHIKKTDLCWWNKDGGERERLVEEHVEDEDGGDDEVEWDGQQGTQVPPALSTNLSGLFILYFYVTNE